MFNLRCNGKTFRKQCSAAKWILVYGAFIYVTNVTWPNKMSLSDLSFTTQFVLYSFVVLDCRDENPLCRLWSAMGKCKKKATWMKKHCCATCKQVVNTPVNIQTCKYMCSAVGPSLCVVLQCLGIPLTFQIHVRIEYCIYSVSTFMQLHHSK